MNQRRARQLGTLSIYGIAAVLAAALCLPTNTPAAAPPAAVPPVKTPPPAVAPNTSDWSQFQTTVQPFFAKNCISCHGDVNPEGEVSFSHFTDATSLEKQSKSLTKALDMVRSHKMPPKGQPQPTPAESGPVITWLDSYAIKLATAGGKTPGHVTIRRLNRSEYNNTLRDLLAIDYRPADAFPVDDAGYGFDNNGDVLNIAPMLMEKYLATAASVLDRAINVDPIAPPPTQQWMAASMPGTLPPSDPKATSGSGFSANMLNGRIFTHAGEIYEDYDFPEAGTYILRVRGYGNTGTVDRQPPTVVFKIDGKPVDKPIQIKVNQSGTTVLPTGKIQVTGGKHRVSLAFTNGATAEEAATAATQPVAIPATAPATQNGRRGGGFGNGRGNGPASAPASMPASGIPATRPAAVAASAPASRPATSAPASAPASRPATFPGRGRGGRGPQGLQASPTGKPNLGVVYIEVEGPQELTITQINRMPESYRKVFVTLPSATVTPEAAARKIIDNFASKAFRRPVTPAELDRLFAFWDKIWESGEEFDRSISLALQPVLASPNFLYRIETGPTPSDPEGIRTLNDFELASRLSYFLWSSMPDDELFNLARQGKLHANLDAQVRRMIASPKSVALVEDFAGQWLQLRKMNDVSPDAKKFPTFDDNLRAAMLKETQLFFTTIMTEDRSVLEFINSDFTFLNETLAKHYGRTDIKGDAFRRVSLKNDPRGGGLLTQASILTLTSYPHRTSPVIRGKWVLENLLDAAPPPPPPDVPKLAEGDKPDLSATLRQRMEQHRANPNCVSCHSQMDPIGFGLENFDAIGKWRDKDTNDQVIDASGELPDGKTFKGAADLKTVLLSRKDEFVNCLANRMLTYALGRGVERSDLLTVRAIADNMKSNNYKFSALVTAIVHSEPFQKQGIKRGEQ